jgi:hypothetical protein
MVGAKTALSKTKRLVRWLAANSLADSTILHNASFAF